MGNHYNESGDLIVEAGIVLRPVGWRINGGVNDGKLVSSEELEAVLAEAAHGGYSPVYIEIGE